MRQNPKISNIKTVFKSKIFCIESMDIEFSNGVERTYERLNSRSSGAVLVVPMLDNDTALMIYEFSGGTQRYELGFVKGKIDDGESPTEAAQRELKEEIGYGAKKLTPIKSVTLSPSYQSSETHIILAENLYKSKKEGDEPEPLEVVAKKLSDIESLAYNKYLTEARSILALYMVRDFIKNQ